MNVFSSEENQQGDGGSLHLRSDGFDRYAQKMTAHTGAG